MRPDPRSSYGRLMTTIDPHDTASSLDDVLAAANDLAPELRARAPEVETARSLPPDLLEGLVSAGLFHFLLPLEFGGAGATLSEAYEVYETVSRADASAGWLVMIGSGIWIDLAGLEPTTFQEVVGRGALLAGVFRPSGTAEPIENGYRVSGCWAFASGCGHSRWIYGNCIDASGDQPVVRSVVLPSEEVLIEDSWHVLGLRGTGSHHFSVERALVPAERTCTEDDPRVCDVPILRIPAPAVFALAVASVALGAARGALDSLTAVARERTPLLSRGPLVTNPLHHRGLAHTQASLQAARALLHDRAGELWATAEVGDPISLAQRARARSAAVWITDRAVEVASWAFRAGGGSAVFDTSALQRRLRDVHTMAQHFLVRDDTLVTAGAVLSGQELDVSVF